MSTFEIYPFDPHDASDDTLRPVHAFLAKMETERNPENPPRTLQFLINNFQNFTLLTDEKALLFYAWHGNAIVGEAFIVVGLDEENNHLLSGDIQVLADYRRQGIGSALLSRVVQIAEAENRKLILATTDSAIPSGNAFAKRVGASVGLVEETRQLYLGDIDSNVLHSWKQTGPVEEFDLLTWLGPYPDNFLEAMADLQEVMNTAPKGELDYEDESVTPQDIRESEAYEAARGFERWTLVAQHKASGTLAGFTEVDWHPDNPQLLIQGDTAVDPKYRRKGLGRWLKASMLALILQNRKQVTRIRTENATSNSAMLKINDALGFRHHKTTTEWQVDIAVASAYLKQHGLEL